MIIAFSLCRHCVYIIKTIALVKKSDVGIFLKYVSPPDAVNMNLGSRQIWETFNERNPAESERTQLKMCVESILLMLKSKEKINLNKWWLELESKIIRHREHFFCHLGCHLILQVVFFTKMKNESQLTTAEQSFSFWYSENGEEHPVCYSTNATYKSCCGKTNANLGSAIT